MGPLERCATLSDMVYRLIAMGRWLVVHSPRQATSTLTLSMAIGLYIQLCGSVLLRLSGQQRHLHESHMLGWRESYRKAKGRLAGVRARFASMPTYGKSIRQGTA